MDAIPLLAIIKSLILPPGLPLILGLSGALVMRRRRSLGKLMILSAGGGLWLLCTPAVVALLVAPLEQTPTLNPELIDVESVDAIVILGGGARRGARAYGGGDSVSRLTMERVRYGAFVHRETGLPLAVTGGSPGEQDTSEGELMAQMLTDEFGVHVDWVETQSRNTAENAELSASAFDFRAILLVTHAMHMPRAKRAFERAGFTVTPAPAAYYNNADDAMEIGDWLPSETALAAARYACYEYFGALWYRLSK